LAKDFRINLKRVYNYIRLLPFLYAIPEQLFELCREMRNTGADIQHILACSKAIHSELAENRNCSFYVGCILKDSADTKPTEAVFFVP
jgi:hypothetical protein